MSRTSRWSLSPSDERSSVGGTAAERLHQGIVRALKQDGFSFTERQGSQRIYRHPDGRRVVVRYHRANATLPPYVLRNLLIGTGWAEADLRRLKLIQ